MIFFFQISAKMCKLILLFPCMSDFNASFNDAHFLDTKLFGSGEKLLN